MSVDVIFTCDGDHGVGERVSANGTRRIVQRFHGVVNGRPWGFGHYVVSSVLDVVPEGWVAFCPVGATYCPQCVEEIWANAKGASDAS